MCCDMEFVKVIVKIGIWEKYSNVWGVVGGRKQDNYVKNREKKPGLPLP